LEIEVKIGAIATFRQTFTTLNTLTPNARIDMQLKDGPFKQLNGAWIFIVLAH
jgi:ribosome-associated toxin RatA of RatAB toxin-antitoxin module